MIQIAYTDIFVLELPDGHKFPMEKYALIKEQLLYEGTITSSNLYDPGLIDEDLILLTHCKEYWNRIKARQLSSREIRRIGFPDTDKLVNRSRSSSNGTVHSAIYALSHGIGMNTAGGTHHAYHDKGEGFCLLNDIAIAANHLLSQGLIKKALVIDLDVHQGNGTASIFQDTSSVFTFSMHGADNYPLKKEKSDLDIALKFGTGDDVYLNILKKSLPKLIAEVKPDFIFYQAGVDVLETDKLGKLALSRQACKERDELVLNLCYEKGIPVAVTMGGGYSERIADIVEAHCNTFRTAFSIYE